MNKPFGHLTDIPAEILRQAEQEQRLSIIVQLLERGELLPAAELLKQLDPTGFTGLRQKGALVRCYLALGQGYLTRGQIEAAEEILETLCSIEPNNSSAYTLFGKVCARKGDRRRAVECWERALACRPEDLEARRALADYYYEQREFDRYREAVLALVQAGPSPANVLNASRALNALDWGKADPPPEKTVRVALLGSFTLDLLSHYLTVELWKAGLYPEVYLGGYNLYHQEILNPRGELYRFNPDIVFLAVGIDSIIPQVTTPFDLKEEVLDLLIERLVSLVSFLMERSPALVVLHNFAIPGFLPVRTARDSWVNSLKEVYLELNRRLAAAFEHSRQVFVLDYDHLTSRHGKDRCVNPKLHYVAHMEMSESFLPLVARKYTGYIKALKGLARKCLVVDLDNTLWGGIVGEDGLEGIRLSHTGFGKEFYDFQRLLLNFFQRGLLLAINSKNNYDEAMRVIREHPCMLLREEHFACMRINWQDKVTNMREIARELNVGLDSLVFIDDDPAERWFMKQALPEVLTVDLPKDPAFYRGILEDLNDFEVLWLTEDDLQRGERYATQRAREELRRSSLTVEDFLMSLRMEVDIRPAEAKSLGRVAQLTQRTNQFNLTTKRYTEGELREYWESGRFRIYTMQVRDLFGDNGLVGVAIVERVDARWRIDSFLLSCRVLGRRLEEVLMNRIVVDARQEGVETVEGTFRPTPKNHPSRDFYRDYGFALRREERGSTTWCLRVGEHPLEELSWIRFSTSQ